MWIVSDSLRPYGAVSSLFGRSPRTPSWAIILRSLREGIHAAAHDRGAIRVNGAESFIVYIGFSPEARAR
jgi:hypothetical protein